jgi:hypothetical protein
LNLHCTQMKFGIQFQGQNEDCADATSVDMIYKE